MKLALITLLIVNNTGVPIRIDRLSNRCNQNKNLITNPIEIDADKSYTKQLSAIATTFTICGNGTCMDSAVGLTNIAGSTTILTANLVDGHVDTTQSPDVWPGNLKCGNSK